MNKLRDYQREDCNFLKKYKHAACFNQQRTGKTPTSIRAMVERNITKLLVVCPASAIYPWVEEIQAWSPLPATALVGTPKQKERLLSTWNVGALVVSYDSLKMTQRSKGLIEQLKPLELHGVILDEAHRIKNRTSANAKAAFALSKFIPFRLALTGTPAPNRPEEVWSILHFLYPSQFKSYWKFINTYFYTYRQSAGTHQYMQIGEFRPGKQLELQQILAKCSTQRKRRDVMQWLPEKEYQKVYLPPTKQQQKYLAELEEYYETEHVVTQTVLDRLIRYRQICLDPGLLDLKGTSPKTDWILQYLADYPNQPTIIFSKFTSFLKRLAPALTKYPFGLIVGDTSLALRKQYIDDFQQGRLDLLLINIDAGKEALTLDRAEAVIFTDKYPPVGDLEQAEDRFVSTTPDKADKPHLIYELIMKGTYDEELYTLLAKRASAVDAINDFRKYLQRKE